MTREEAIHILDNLKPTNTKSSFDAYVVGKAITMAIKALEQEPSGDLISRQAVLDWFCMKECGRQFCNCRCDSGECDDHKALSNIPSVKQEPKTGHWEQYGYPWEDRFKCSECGEKQPKILCGERIIEYWSDYCPNCGAKMESEDKECRGQ